MEHSNSMTTLGLIDVSHIFRSCAAAMIDDDPMEAVNATLEAVRRISTASRLTHTVVCLDKPPYNRARIYPLYKANRKPKTEELIQQQRDTYAGLQRMGAKLAFADGYEADDIIATLTKHAKANGWKVEIFSADKDLCQLVDLDVKIVSTRKSGEVLDYAAVKEKFGLPPNKLGDYLALCGDSSDNIPGCPSVGPKKAVQLLKDYVDLDGVLAATDIPGKMGEAIRENVEQINLSRVLVELDRSAPLVWGDLFDAPESGKVAKVQDAEFEDAPNDGPTAGDKLIGGALSRQAAAQAPPPKSRPKQRPVAQAPPPPSSEPKQAAPEAAPGPSIVKAAPVAPAERALTTVELRPGLSVSNEQMNMYVRLASELYEGGLYVSFPNKAAIFTIILMGIDLGLSPTAALGSIHLIEGRPSPGAHLLIARAEADPNCEWLECTESTTTSATYQTKRRRGSGEVLTFHYTMEDAKRAGMLQGGSRYNWEKRPREMLAKTCGSQAVRLWYAGSITGLYSAEEMGHDVGNAA